MQKIFLSLLSGFLLAFSWPSIGVSYIIFFALVPLFFLERNLHNSGNKKKGKEVFWFSFLTFFIFNIITTYWIYHATFSGAIAAFLVNSTLMATAFYLFHRIKSLTTYRLGYLGFVVCWISMEYLHLNWDLSWPWLTLGNSFANTPDLVQWYEFTGILGGSLWVLLINILIFEVLISFSFRKVGLTSFLLLTPIIGSYYIKDNITQEDSLKVLIVQPNIDPFIDKFSIGYKQQLTDFIDLVKTSIDIDTELLIGPETALLEGIWENKIRSTYSVIELQKLQEYFPELNILVGASTYKIFETLEDKTATARQIRNEDMFYDAYNSAIFISDSGGIQVYHKQKLVPGAEKMPFPNILDPLAKLMVNLGGISGSLGSENKLNYFNLNNNVIITPLICYESVYSDLKIGKTNLIAIITNDGWWKNTAGYKQHFAYARLRAIEQRKTIVRSANTGISGIINSNGEVIEKSNWDEATCISAEVQLNDQSTFYSSFGDYIGRLSSFLAVLLLIVAFVKGRLKK